MALTYRSPIEEVLTYLEPTAQSLIAAAATTSYQLSEKENFEWFHYSLNAVAKEHLSNAGIYLSPFSGYPHSHPVCKTLENYLLYKVLPGIINNSFYFVGIKQFKLNFLKARHKNLDLIRSLNRYVSSADKIRYGNEFVIRKSSELRALKRHTLAESDTLRDLVPNVPSYANLFLHDELHYWSKEQLITFLEICKPEIMLGTVVYPPEILAGSKKSLNPWCYEYEIKSNRLLYYPDGVRAEGYDQPLEGGYLLKANRLQLLDGSIYCVDIVASKFSHHLVSITRGEMVTPTYRSFGPFEAVHSGAMKDISRAAGESFPVGHHTVLRMYRYLRSLKKPDKQSAMAKFSQLNHEPSGEAIKFMEELSHLIIETKDIRTVIKPELIRGFFGNLGRRLPPSLASKLDSTRSVCLDEFIGTLKPLSVDLKLITITAGYMESISGYFAEAEEEVTLPENIDQHWIGANSDREPMPYIGLAPLRDYAGFWKMASSKHLAVKLLSELFKQSHFHEQTGFSKPLTEYRAELAKATRITMVSIVLVLNEEEIDELEIHLCSINSVKTSWHFHGVLWFKHNRRQRFNTSFLVNPISQARCDEFEWSTYQKKAHKRNYTFSTYCEEELDGKFTDCAYVPMASTKSYGNAASKINYTFSTYDGEDSDEMYTDYVHNPTSDVQTQGVESDRSVPPGKDVPLEAGKCLECDCKLALPVKKLFHTEDCETEFTDSLKGRKAAWFSAGGVPYTYSGGSHHSKGWPRWLSLWMEVNGIEAKYDCMLAQKYNQNAGVGFHSDDEALFEKNESIFTVNLYGEAEFGIKCGARANWLKLEHGDCFEMPAGFQEDHKHSVKCTTEGRVSFTFRVLKKAKAGAQAESTVESPNSEGANDDGVDGEVAEEPGMSAGNDQQASNKTSDKGKIEERPFDVEKDGVRISCKSDVRRRKLNVIPNKGGGDCFWLALSHFTGVSVKDMKAALKDGLKPNEQGELKRQLEDKVWSEDEALIAACKQFGFNLLIIDEVQSAEQLFTYPLNSKLAFLRYGGGHFEAVMPVEGCTIRALAECVQRRESEVCAVLSQALGESFVDGLLEGKGVDLEQFARMCMILDVRCVAQNEHETILLNEGGRVEGHFILKDGHATFQKMKATSTHVQTNVHKFSIEVTDTELLPISNISSRVNFTPSPERAKLLSESLLQGSTGVLCSELYNDQVALMPDDPVLGPRILHTVLGTFGCGKSTVIRAVMRGAPSKAIIYISPRRFLCEDFTRAISEIKKEFGKAAGSNFKSLTFEKALLQATRIVPGALVVLDEVQLFPPGFLSLLCCLLHEDVKIAIFGDPCQSDYDSEKDRAVLGALESDIVDALGNQSYKYNVVSHRFKGAMFRGRLPCEHAEEPCEPSKLEIVEGLESVDINSNCSGVCLVSSFEEKKIVQAYFGSKCKALTFGESTGANFDEGSILVTQVSAHTNEKRWLTALSRFRKRVCLINASGVGVELLMKVYAGRALNKFLSMTASLDDLKPLLPGKPQFTYGFDSTVFGADEGKREEKLQGDPWLKTMVDLLQVEDMEDIEEAKVLLQDEWCRTHLPQCELEGVRARWVHKILAKEFRERRMGHLVSEQFTDEHSKQKGKELSNAAERFETIYPRHRASDTVTFVMAVRKRLRFSNPVKESAKLNQAMPYGPFLLKEFLKHVPLKPMHNKRMMEEAKFDFEEKKTSKSAATIENHSNRSMREWAIDIGLVFSKSQLCTKFDNRFRDAKAAQTIVCFQHAVLCRFAPYMRYIEKKLNEVLPSKYYIHSGKGLEELNAWVKEGGFGRICTESDYEAFDASQDQYIVAFEISLMRYLGLPPSLIEDYKFIKTHLGSKLGSFAIMRFSGEASTFLFNTMANMLFTFLQYDIKGDERICFAGDDMCSNKRLHVSKKHAGFLKKLKLKAKVAHTDHPTFCGWNLCPDGIFKKPQLVLERLCIAKETNNLVNCIDNYAIEVSFAYKMGERAKERMNEEEVEAFYNCVRIIIKNKHLLKSDVLQVYQTGLVM